MTRQICTEENPYKEGKPGQWQHPLASETDYDSDYTIEYRCPVCGKIRSNGSDDHSYELLETDR
mgnify:CR=1 FL=1